MAKPKRTLDRRRLLVDWLRRHAPASRIKLARAFGMNPSTISVTVSQLVESGMVRECPLEGARAGGRGRPETGLTVRREATHFLGLEFDRERVNGAVVDLGGGVVHRTAVDLWQVGDARECLAILCRTAQRLYRRAKRAGRAVEGVGVGAPGRVDRVAGTAASYAAIPGWEDVAVAGRLAAALDLPVFVDNNASCFALGEAWQPDHRAYGRVGVVLMRTGVGFGLAEDRRLAVRGRHSGGELGHTVVRMDGVRCTCGRRGCLEAYASGRVLREALRKRAARSPQWWQGMRRRAGRAGNKPDTIRVEQLCRVAEAGDAFLKRRLTEMFGDLACAAENAVRLHAPDLLVFQGRFNGPLMRSVLAGNAGAGEARADACRWVVSDSPEAIGATGAALLAAERLYAPLPEPGAGSGAVQRP